MTKAKNILCFQPVNFSVRSFFDVDLANIGNLWHSVPNGFFVKRQCWRGLEYRFAQIYLAKNFYRGKRKRGGLVPLPSSALVAPSILRVAFAYAFRRYEHDLRRARCLFIQSLLRMRYSACGGGRVSGVKARSVGLSSGSMNGFY
ncbi:hypothetical protein AA471_12100 [Salmonella enterica subsp. enterica]|nr:hypothetical protein [Salmonella enterica subsp. enterica]EDQ2988792.1 hypothetical protein [Salmonella enterica subsp. enterica]